MTGSPRRTVDFKALNNASCRQTHHIKTPFMLASRVPAFQKKSVLDVWNAYHLVPIREEVLEGLHMAHQGVAGMSHRAQQAVFWPGIYKDLEQKRAACRDCCTRAPSQPALPPVRLASPEYPFQMWAADYCNVKGKSWLVVVDRFTGWISLFYFPDDASASKLVKILSVMVTTFGAPSEISTDCGPQFVSREFTAFLQMLGTHHRHSAQ